MNQFHIPPRNQGQIVETAYAQTMDGHVIRRTYDRSDRSTQYYVSTQLHGDDGDYWNQEPRNKRWAAISEHQALSLLGGDED